MPIDYIIEVTPDVTRTVPLTGITTSDTAGACGELAISFWINNGGTNDQVVSLNVAGAAVNSDIFYHDSAAVNSLDFTVSSTSLEDEGTYELCMQAKHAALDWEGCAVNSLLFQVNLINPCLTTTLQIESSILLDQSAPIPYSVFTEGSPTTLDILAATLSDHVTLIPQ